MNLYGQRALDYVQMTDQSLLTQMSFV